MIPAIAALAGVALTSVVTYLVGQERLSQRVERLANAREKIADNKLLTRYIDMELKAELKGSLLTRQSRFYLQVYGWSTLVLTITTIATTAIYYNDDRWGNLSGMITSIVFLVLSYNLLFYHLYQHLKAKRSTAILR